MTQVGFRCSCGKVKGLIHQAEPAHSTHCICHCEFCRAGIAFGGEEDPGAEGADLLMTTPDRIELTEGSFFLEPFAFGPKNMLRWRAACCGVMVFATQRRPRFPLASILVRRLEDQVAIGPVVAQGFMPQPSGKTKHQNMGAILRALGRALRARITGAWRKTPFFDTDTGEPVAPVIQVTRQERKALLTS